LASDDEIKIATCGGVRISRGCGFSKHTMKVQSVTFESKAKLINNGSSNGFGELKYLTNLATTSRTDRHKQQSELSRYMKEVGCQSIFVAMLRGECLIYSDKDSDISSMASQEIRIVVRGLLELKSKWQTLNHTYIHREVEDLSKDYSNLVVLDAPALLLIDSFLKRAILKFLPTTNEVIAYTINGAAVKDSAKTILVIHNPNPGTATLTLPTKSKWSVLVKGAIAGTKTIQTLNLVFSISMTLCLH
jgi:hypothetical protein